MIIRAMIANCHASKLLRIFKSMRFFNPHRTGTFGLSMRRAAIVQSHIRLIGPAMDTR
jgi:hypothetical protein